MIPVALVGWVVAYLVLAWYFRDALADEEPALGARAADVPLDAPRARRARDRPRAQHRVVSGPRARSAAAVGRRRAGRAALRRRRARARRRAARRSSRGVSWELVPFVFGVLVLATALARAGVTDELAHLYARSPAPLPTVGGVAAVGSALINNHPMALLHSLALAGAPDRLVYAALVGGDLGPRLLPIGSLAGLLWLHSCARAASRSRSRCSCASA